MMSQFRIKAEPDITDPEVSGWHDPIPSTSVSHQSIYTSFAAAEGAASTATLIDEGIFDERSEFERLHMQTSTPKASMSSIYPVRLDDRYQALSRKPWDFAGRTFQDFHSRPEVRPRVQFELPSTQGLSSSYGTYPGQSCPVSLAPSGVTPYDRLGSYNDGYGMHAGPKTTPSWATGGRYSRGPATVTSSRSVNTNPFTSAPGLGYGTGFNNFDHNPAYGGAYGNSPFTPRERPVNDLRRRELDADFYDGTSDLTDYLAHFEQVADYNGWSDAQRARVLCVKLKGEARKVLRSLSMMEKTDYDLLQLALTRVFDPQEMEMAHRSVYKNRRRQKGESVAQFGFELRRLAQKAYPALSIRELEVHIIDQYLEGLGDKELRMHVQLHHPQTLSQAIGLAVEYCSVDNPQDKLLKPVKEHEERNSMSVQSTQVVNSLRPLNYQTEFSIQDLQSLISSVVEQKLGEFKGDNKVPSSPGTSAPRAQGSRGGERHGRPQRGQNQNRGQATVSKEGQGPAGYSGDQKRDRRDVICTFYGKSNHVESRCLEKQRVKSEQDRVRTMAQEN